MRPALEQRGGKLWANGPYGHIQVHKLQRAPNNGMHVLRRCKQCNRGWCWLKAWPPGVRGRCPACGLELWPTNSRYRPSGWYEVSVLDAPRLVAPPMLTINYVCQELDRRGWWSLDLRQAYNQARDKGQLGAMRQYLGLMQCDKRVHDLVPLVYSLYKQLELA